MILLHCVQEPERYLTTEVRSVTVLREIPIDLLYVIKNSEYLLY